MRLKSLLKSLLPGIFLFGYCIGTGSVTAMAKAGADYGMALLWTVALSCVITFYLIDLYGKFTLVTGESALAAFRKHIHPLVGLFFVVSLTVNVSGSVIGVMGILADVCYVWSQQFVEGGIRPVWFAGFFIVLVYLLFLDGRTRVFEKVLALVVGVMALCFVISLLITAPSLVEIGKGLVPSIPDVGEGRSSFLVIASMVGTTVFSGLFILRGSLVKEAGWTLESYGTQRRDAAFSAGLMFLVSGSIMAAGAATLHAKGMRLENVSEMIALLEPLAGSFAVGLFATGVVAAGVSSQFPNVTLLPWLLNDYCGRGTSMRRMDYRVFVLGISLLGLVVPVFDAKPILVMMTSQAFGALILPATVLCLIIVGNRKGLMKEHCFGIFTNALLGLILIFALFMSYLSYTGLFAAIRSLG